MTKRIAKSLTIALACLLLCAPTVTNAISPLNRAKPERGPSANDPTVLSVLALAMQQAELPRNEAFRLPLRYRVAIAIRRARQELSFGEYVYNSIKFWEAWDPKNSWIDRELATRQASIEAQAKKIFLAGNQDEARSLLDRRGCQSPLVRCAHPSVDTLFLQWELDTGDFAAAVRRMKETNWQSPGNKIYHANLVANALMDARKRNEALQFLSELRSTPGLDAAIAELYWIHGATEEAKRLMREAAEKELDEAARDPKKELPVRIPGSQWIMGDKDGAIATLNRILQFDKDRLSAIRAPLAGRLALAGRDADASALSTGTPADRATLANIAVGQARRGDFEAALKTIEQLNGFTVPRFDDTPNNPGPITAVVAIERLAARAGKVEFFRKADDIRHELNRRPPVPWIIATSAAPRLAGPYVFGDLTRTGHARFAIDYALATVDLNDRIAGLCAVAEALAGIPDKSHNPFEFFETW